MAGTFIGCWRQYRAFRRLPRSDRRIVFYAESGQDWHHWRDLIGHLTTEMEETSCYVSSDPDDPGLHQGSPRISPFWIGRGLWRTWFFQWLDADILVTQLLDLDILELKRSIHPVHYVYVFHSLVSTHMADRADSFDHYDTILCAGPHQMREIRRREELHHLAPKQLIPHGYARLEQLMAARRTATIAADAGIHVLMAPSWGAHTILPTCGLELTGILLDAGFRVTLRPHFQTRWATPKVIDRVIHRYRGHPRFALVEEMGDSESLFDAHVMVTDWSGAALDFGLGLEKPVLFVDVPPKAERHLAGAGYRAVRGYVRDKIGVILSPDRLAEGPDLIQQLVQDAARFRCEVSPLRDERVFNLGHSGAAGGEAIARVARAAAASGGDHSRRG